MNGAFDHWNTKLDELQTNDAIMATFLETFSKRQDAEIATLRAELKALKQEVDKASGRISRLESSVIS
jgi:hypothetical protein